MTGEKKEGQKKGEEGGRGGGRKPERERRETKDTKEDPIKGGPPHVSSAIQLVENNIPCRGLHI